MGCDVVLHLHFVLPKLSVVSNHIGKALKVGCSDNYYLIAKAKKWNDLDTPRKLSQLNSLLKRKLRLKFGISVFYLLHVKLY